MILTLSVLIVRCQYFLHFIICVVVKVRNTEQIQWNLSTAETLRPEIFGHFCCNIEFLLLKRSKCIGDICWDQNFCTYYGGFFYCFLNLEVVKRGSTVYG